MQLVGLPDTKSTLEADIVYSPSAVLKSLRVGRAATTAGDNGAINVWVDDNDDYRGEEERRMFIAHISAALARRAGTPTTDARAESLAEGLTSQLFEVEGFGDYTNSQQREGVYDLALRTINLALSSTPSEQKEQPK